MTSHLYTLNIFWLISASSKPQPNQNSHHDSGFYGSFDSPDSSRNSNASLNYTISTPYKSNLWHSITSPMSSIKNRFTGRGRQNFLDDERSGRWKVQPQQILGCLLFVTIFSSLGFAVLISVKHFGAGQEGSTSSEPVNGKYQSLKFANEKMNVEEPAGKNIENANVDPQEVSPINMASDPIFDVINEIGQMSDRDLSEKMEKLGPKIKASGIKIQKVEDTSDKSKDVLSVDAISEELLTTRPLIVEHPAPTQAPRVRHIPRYEDSNNNDKTTENVIDKDSSIEKYVSKDLVNSSSDVLEVQKSTPPKNNLKSRKKSRSVNPLTKTLKVDKMSKAKMIEKVTASLRDIESVDYPDLPTFRGLQPDDDETDAEAGKNDEDYPEDPSSFR